MIAYLRSSSPLLAARNPPPVLGGYSPMTGRSQVSGRYARWRGCRRGTKASTMWLASWLPKGGKEAGKGRRGSVPYPLRLAVGDGEEGALLAVIPYILIPAILDQLFICGSEASVRPVWFGGRRSEGWAEWVYFRSCLCRRRLWLEGQLRWM